jgi:hypothetical protein
MAVPFCARAPPAPLLAGEGGLDYDAGQRRQTATTELVVICPEPLT